MRLASCLHKAGLVCLFEQLLCERHEACVFHQAPSLRHLRGQCLPSFLPRHLQSLGEGGMALGQSGRQIPDALSQLLSGRHAVYLVANNADRRVCWIFCWKCFTTTTTTGIL